MKKGRIFNSYNVMQPQNNRYQINMNNEIVRELYKIYRLEKNIPYGHPLSDKERANFEKIIIRADIKDSDGMVVALEKFKKAFDTPKRGYTSEDVQALKRKILGKEV